MLNFFNLFLLHCLFHSTTAKKHTNVLIPTVYRHPPCCYWTQNKEYKNAISLPARHRFGGIFSRRARALKMNHCARPYLAVAPIFGDGDSSPHQPHPLRFCTFYAFPNDIMASNRNSNRHLARPLRVLPSAYQRTVVVVVQFHAVGG